MAALIAVLEKAVRDGVQETVAVKKNLISNNPATCPLLMMLPDKGTMPSMRHVERTAPCRVLDSLSLLAQQCAAAGCQPLEVFERSLECTSHRAALESKANGGIMAQRQQQIEELAPRYETALKRFANGSSCPDVTFARAAVAALAQQEVSHKLQDVITNFFTTFWGLCESNDHPGWQLTAELDHMLPGETGS